MLHNIDYNILEQYLSDYSAEIYGRQLIGKIPLSQKAIALALEKLERGGILKSRRSGNMKFYSLNTKTFVIKDIMAITEMFKKVKFLENNKVIAQIFKSDENIVGVFGSYAKNKQKHDSDLDIFIIGEKNNDYGSQGKMFDISVSIRNFSVKEAKELIKKKNPLIKEIITNHVLLFNVERFIELLWGDYYGFD